MPNNPQYELFNDNQTSNKEDLSRLKGLYDLFKAAQTCYCHVPNSCELYQFQSGTCDGLALAGFCHSSEGWGGGRKRRWKKSVGQHQGNLLEEKGAILCSVWIYHCQTLPTPSLVERGSVGKSLGAVGAGLRPLVCYQHTALGGLAWAKWTLFPPEPAPFPCYRYRKWVGCLCEV